MLLHKKILIISLSLIGAGIFANQTLAATCPLAVGKPYKIASSPATYYLMNDCKKYPIKNEGEYFSYFSNWKEVKTVSSKIFSRITPTAKNIRPPQATPPKVLLSTPIERGMIGIQVVNKITGRPVPGVPINVPYSSEQRFTNEQGYVEFPRHGYESVYVPKMHAYYVSEMITLRGRTENTITINLEPEKIDSRTVVFPTTTMSRSNDVSTAFSARVIDHIGAPVVNFPVAVAHTSLYGKTDSQGNLFIQLPGETNSFQFYFPSAINPIYYHIDIIKGYTISTTLVIPE